MPLQPGEGKTPVMPREFMMTPANPVDPYATPQSTKKNK